MEIWEWVQKIAFWVVGSLVGFYLGIRAKRPYIVTDYIKITEKETHIRLNNVGGSAAIDVKVENAIMIFNPNPNEPFYETFKGKKLIFTFDKINYIEPSKPKEVVVRAHFGDEIKEADSARLFYSYSLYRFKFFEVIYKDSFGIRYKNRLKIEKEKK